MTVLTTAKRLGHLHLCRGRRGVLLALGLIQLGGCLAAGALEPEVLKVEYTANPLGIDVAQPRLSWTLASDERAQRQTAYQVVVGSSPEALAGANGGDGWDTRKVISRETLAGEAVGVSFQRMEEGCAVFEVGSGEFVFSVR